MTVGLRANAFHWVISDLCKAGIIFGITFDTCQDWKQYFHHQIAIIASGNSLNSLDSEEGQILKYELKFELEVVASGFKNVISGEKLDTTSFERELFS